MATIAQERITGHCVPELYPLISTPRGDAAPIGRPGQSVDPTGMPTIGAQRGSGGRIPDLPSLIIGPARDAPAIGRPGHRIHRERPIPSHVYVGWMALRLVGVIHEELSPGGCIPDLHGVIPAC